MRCEEDWAKSVGAAVVVSSVLKSQRSESSEKGQRDRPLAPLHENCYALSA